MSDFYSGRGDDGTTGLLGEGRVPKYHPRPRAYGSVDEASAALGLARAQALSDETRVVIVTVQRDLYAMMAELAATRQAAPRFRALNNSRLAWLEAQVQSFGERVEMPKGFILGGDCLAGASLDLARTLVRRAEREVAELAHQGEVENPDILPYLNRLSSLCFVLILWENRQAGIDRPSLAKPDPA